MILLYHTLKSTHNVVNFYDVIVVFRIISCGVFISIPSAALKFKLHCII